MTDITGDNGSNTLVGTTDPDLIIGNGGDDKITGGNGNDTILGGDGADNINGNADNDALYGGAGDDTITGANGDDIVSGGLGNDKLEGGAGSDNLSFFGSGYTSFYGLQNQANGPVNLFYRGVTVDLMVTTAQNTGEGLDTITGFENITGSAYVDRFSGTNTANIIEGRDGDDWLAGRGGADNLHGGNGNDTIDANGDFGTGSQIFGANDGAVDYVTGGAGNDVIGVSMGDIADGGDDTDTLMVTFAAAINLDLSTGALAALQAATGGAFTNFELFNVVGSAAADTITGDGAANEIWGMGGDDLINGGAGYDALFGGAGNDTLNGGGGLDGDRLVGGDGSDTLIGGDGNDYLSANQGVLDINGLTYLSTQSDDGDVDNVTGGAGNDTIYVGLGDNASGGDGAIDTLYVTFENYVGPLFVNLGEGGMDVLSALTGGTYSGFERFSLYGTNLNDTIYGDASVNNLWGRGGDDVMSGGASGDLLGGNDGDDTLNGDGGNDALYGGAGADTMNGGDGDDSIYVFSGTQSEPFSPGNDIIDGGAGIDIISFNPTFIGAYAGQLNIGNAFAITANVTINLAVTGPQNTGVGVMTITNVENLAGGQGADTFHGNNANNYFWGGDGADYLNGWGGNDQLYGGAGDDLLRGETGVDYFDGGTGFDRISFYNPNSTQGVVVDLRTGVISNDGFGNVESFTGIEAIGVVTRFADTIHGDDNRNLLYASLGDSVYGYGGDDDFQVDSAMAVLDGGAGFDVIRGFFGSRFIDANGDGVSDSEYATHGVFVDLAANMIVDDGFGGSASIISIEGAYGSSFADRIQGSWAANELGGLGGNDILIGWGGDDTLNGGDGDDILYGEEGKDTYNGGEGFDRISFYNFWATQGANVDLRTQTVHNDGFGNAETMTSIEGLGNGTRFADTFNGNDADNLILVDTGDIANGWGGDDRFQYSGAAAVVDGGAGNDTITLFTGSRLVDRGDGVAEVQYADRGVTVNLATRTIINDGFGSTGKILNIENLGGSAFNDLLTGSTGDNLLWGREGYDTINAGAGNDQVSGGADGDVIKGEAGNDELYGDDGDDSLNGGLGDDLLDGGEGADRAVYVTATGGVTLDLEVATAQNVGGGQGLDTLVSIESAEGSNYDDVLRGSAGANVLLGYNGKDNISGRGGDDFIGGDAGDDVVNGDGGEDIVSGGLGNDTVNGGDDADQLYGDLGNDTVNGDEGNDEAWGGAGNDTVNGGAGSDILWGEAGIDAINGGDGDDEIDGGDGVDTLHGDAGADTIQAGAGNDYVYGDADNDLIYGGLGNDALNGGDGDDEIYGQDGNDLINGNSGADLVYGGIGMDTIDGGDDDDGLHGGDGNDTVRGGAGNDVISGGLGKDTLTGGAGYDSFVFNDVLDSAGAFRDTITDFSSDDYLIFTAIDADTTTDGDQAFTIVSKFTGQAGEMVVKVSAALTQVMADVDGDGVADLWVLITGSHADTSGYLL